jgi:Phosphotransferase enzyme family
MRWVKGLMVPDRLRLRATIGPGGAQAARLLYHQQRRHLVIAAAARRGRSVALSWGVGERCPPPVEAFDELCDLLGVVPVGAAAIYSRGYPARVADRLVLCIVGRDASVVVKVGSRLDGGISTEAMLLISLNGSAGPVIVPRVRWNGTWREHVVLATEALQLADRQRSVSVEEAADTATALTAGVATVGPMVHRDLSPWNILRTPHALCLLDWEGARLGREPLFDLAHFVIMRGALLRREQPQRAVSLLTAAGSPGWRHLATLGVDPSTAPALLKDYLERSWRHTEDTWPYRKAMLELLPVVPSAQHAPIGLASADALPGSAEALPQ